MVLPHHDLHYPFRSCAIGCLTRQSRDIIHEVWSCTPGVSLYFKVPYRFKQSWKESSANNAMEGWKVAFTLLNYGFYCKQKTKQPHKQVPRCSWLAGLPKSRWNMINWTWLWVSEAKWCRHASKSSTVPLVFKLGKIDLKNLSILTVCFVKKTQIIIKFHCGSECLTPSWSRI